MPFGIAAGVSAAAGIAGSLIQSNAISKGQKSSIDAQTAARDQARADLSPWTGTGGSANTASADLLGLNGPDAATRAMGNFTASPGYQWQLGQGLRAVDAGAAAQGMLRSGATLKAEQTYGQGLANQDFTNYYNRLFDLSKLGENAAGGSATASMNAGKDIAQTDAQAAGTQSSIYGNAAAGISNAANNYANQSLYQSRTNAMMNYGGGGIAGNYNPTALGYTAGGAGTGTLQGLGFYTPLGA
jgi:hypothetical protein